VSAARREQFTVGDSIMSRSFVCGRFGSVQLNLFYFGGGGGGLGLFLLRSAVSRFFLSTLSVSFLRRLFLSAFLARFLASAPLSPE
jgi:hypothetical protein